MLMREERVVCRMLPHLFIPSKTATLVPEFAVEDLPLGKTAALVPRFSVKDLTLVHRCGPGGSMRACHAAGPGSNPGRNKFPG